MIFTTFQFLVFFCIVFTLYFILPKSWRNPFLLGASYYFYMCSVPSYLAVILLITIVDYVAGIKIEESQNQKRKTVYFLASLMSNCGLLFAFKYSWFAVSTFNDILGLGIPAFHILLPLGISFHTFQAVSYTIEVYRGRYPAERNLLNYALYVAFFPQMVAGPIERPYNLLPQFRGTRDLKLGRFSSGIRIALWGLFKKVAVADLIAPAVNTVYAQPDQYTGPLLLLATLLFSVQIYCDFSGYSDIAIGIARMMGYDLMINFRQPYFAMTVREFWNRWHISLSTWFRDYVYIPLGGSRVPTHRYYVNIVAVFLLSGLWHGANWTFATWGLIHGCYIVVGHLTANFRRQMTAALGLANAPKVLGLLQGFTTFSLVTIAWVFFRAASMKDALYIISHFADARGFRARDVLDLGLPRFELAIAIMMIVTTLAAEWLMFSKPPIVVALWSRRSFRWACTYACIFATMFFGVFGKMEFIYFQF